MAAIFLMCCGSLWDYADHRSNVKMVENAAIEKKYTTEGKPLTKELKHAEKKWNEKLYERSVIPRLASIHTFKLRE